MYVCKVYFHDVASIVGDVVDVSDLPMNLVAALLSVSASTVQT